MTKKPLKPKKCRVCACEFVPSRPMQRVCGVECGWEWAKKIAERAKAEDAREERKAHREAKERIKTRGEHLREAQAAFNAWVRARDARLPCISCGRPASWKGQWDAGHYRSRGAYPELRFEPLNVHKQCGPCNVHLSGNLIEYRWGLERRIGKEKLEWIEGKHEAKKYTIEQLKEKKAFYRAETRRLKSAVNSA